MSEIILTVALTTIAFVIIFMIVNSFKTNISEIIANWNSRWDRDHKEYKDAHTSEIEHFNVPTFPINVIPEEAPTPIPIDLTHEDILPKMDPKPIDRQFKLSQTRVQGHSHKKATPQIPCQDYGKAGTLSNGYHVLIVSDGAGSSKLSHVASEFCVNTLYSYLQVVDFKDFDVKPNEIEQNKEKWHNIVKGLFKKLRSKLIEFAEENNISHEDLFCTLVMVIKTDWGFLSANIGDGRSGYSDGNPKALSVPFMTYTVGATFFLIKEDWENMFRSYVTMVDLPEKIKYFFATSDGCQDFVIDNSKKGPREGIYDAVLGDNAFYDNNIPFEPFFDGLIASLNEVSTEEERNNRLKKLVEFGLYQLAGEEKELKTLSDPLLDDDKTFIMFHK